MRQVNQMVNGQFDQALVKLKDSQQLSVLSKLLKPKDKLNFFPMLFMK